jgi:RNA polymerase sigma factor (sigma-70 family)
MDKKQVITCEDVVAHVTELSKFALKLRRGNKTEADDLLQDTLLRALRNLDKFEYRGERSLVSWLLTMMKNLNFNRVRRDIEGPQMFSLDGSLIEYAAPSTQFELLAAREYLLLWYQAYEMLPEKFQIVLWTVVIEFKSYEEAASELNLPIGTVRSRINRAREKIGNFLQNRSEQIDNPSKEF